jgi:hypothetical protein
MKKAMNAASGEGHDDGLACGRQRCRSISASHAGETYGPVCFHVSESIRYTETWRDLRKI